MRPRWLTAPSPLQFSMLLPETTALMEKLATEHVVIFGIESHICVLQTVLAILAQEPRVAVHVIADGVSSCNREEVAIALAVSGGRSSFLVHPVSPLAFSLEISSHFHRLSFC